MISKWIKGKDLIILHKNGYISKEELFYRLRLRNYTIHLSYILSVLTLLLLTKV